MKFIEFATEKEASAYVVKIVIDKIKAKHNINLGLATGSTPIELYKALVADHKQNHTPWDKVSTFNLDEYANLSITSPASYHVFMKEHLFDHVKLNPHNTHFPEGDGSTFDHLVERLGGIDLQILGIGVNGHVGFNEPGASKDSLTRIVDLTPTTIAVNARKFFDNKQDLVPKTAISMGLKSILQVKEIVLLAFGHDKAEALTQLKKAETFDPKFPASILTLHPNVTIVYDKSAKPSL